MDVRLRPAEPDELEYVLSTEARAKADEHLFGWTRDEHAAAFANEDCRYLIVEAHGGRVGFVILRGLLSPHQSIELKRIVVDPPGQGIGRSVINQVLAWAFTERDAHRVWLNVFDHNERARHLYKSLGFTDEGVMREAVRLGNRYVDLRIMGVLREEYLRAPGGLA